MADRVVIGRDNSSQCECSRRLETLAIFVHNLDINCNEKNQLIELFNDCTDIKAVHRL